MAIFTETIRLLIDADTKGAAQPLDHLAKKSKEADTAFGKMAKSMGISASTLKTGLVAGATALVGTGLVQFLNDSVTAFADSAKKASDLANATGGSVDEVSRLTAALEDAGVSAEQTAALLTKFTTSLSTDKGQQAIDDLGVAMTRNADGTVNYTATMVDAVDAIMLIGDASERNKQFVALFGKAGAKAFQDLANSGVSLSDAMAAIEKYRVFTADDVKKAMAYDDAMDGLAASMQGLMFTVGKALAPAISTGTELLTTLVDLFMEIPTPVLAAAAAMVAWRAAMATAMAQSLISGAAVLITGLAASLATVGVVSTISSAGVWILNAALAALEALLAPILLIVAPLLAIAGAIWAVTSAMNAGKQIDAFTTSMDRMGQSLEDQANELRDTDSVWNSFVEGIQFANNETEKQQKRVEAIAESLHNQAEATLENADATDAQRTAAQNLINVMGNGTKEQQAANLATADGKAAQDAYIASLDATAAAQYKVEQTTKTLTEMIMDGSASQQELADAATAANEAQDAQNQATEEAEALMGAYATSIEGVVEWQKKLAGQKKDVEEALGSAQESLTNLAKVVDDPATWQNEVTIATAQAESDIADLVGAWETSGLDDKEIVAKLKVLKKDPATGEDADAVIQRWIDDLPGKTAGAEVPVTPTVEGDDVQAEVDAATAGTEGEVKVGLTVEGGDEVAAAKAEASKPVDVPVTYEVKGLDAVNHYNDDLDGKKLTVTTVYEVKGLDQVNHYNDDLDGKKLKIHVEYVVSGLDAVNRYNDSLNGKNLYINVHYRRIGSSAVDATNNVAVLGRGRPTATPYSSAPVVNQSNTINVTAGNPAQTAREIDRYLSRAGNRALASVTAP